MTQLELWPEADARFLRWRRTRSSFIEAIAYMPLAYRYRQDTAPGRGWVFVKIRDSVYAYLAPIWAYGLLCAAQACSRSVGRLYNRLLRNRCESLVVRSA